MSYRKKIARRYIATAAAAALISFILLYLQGFWETSALAQKYKILSDAFTVPSVILMSIAALIRISSEGVFDGISYALTQLGGVFIPNLREKYRHQRYYDFVTQRQGKTHRGYSFLFGVGILFAIIAVVFTALFNSVYVPRI